MDFYRAADDCSVKARPLSDTGDGPLLFPPFSPVKQAGKLLQKQQIQTGAGRCAGGEVADERDDSRILLAPGPSTAGRGGQSAGRDGHEQGRFAVSAPGSSGASTCSR